MKYDTKIWIDILYKKTDTCRYPQQTFTCSKLTIKTLEKGGKHVQSQQNNKATERDQWQETSTIGKVVKVSINDLRPLNINP